MMKKLSQFLLTIFLFSISTLTFSAEDSDFAEDFDYKKIPSAFQTHSPKDKVEVREIFWYSCPHCYALEPALKAWKKPKSVDFKITPAISANGWAAIGAQTYYTAEVLGILDKFHNDFFKAIHTDKQQKLNSNIATIAKFFEKYGIKEDKFYNAWNSFSVDTKLKQAKKIFTKSGISGVPSVIVAGKYVTSPSMVGGSKRMLKVIEYLVQKELGKK